MEKVNLTERLFFYIVFLILIILALLMIQPYFTILVVSLISVIILKPVYSFYMKRSWIRERRACHGANEARRFAHSRHAGDGR